MIPVLDWSTFALDPAGFSRRLDDVCRDHGFFLLQGHDVPEALVGELFDLAETFFAAPLAEKTALSIADNSHNRGWAALGDEKLDETSETHDRKEAFNIGLDLAPDDPRVLAGEPFRGVNVWPSIRGFRETTLAYFDLVWRLGVDLHRPIAANFGLEPDYFARHFDAPMATLRLLSYPAASGAVGEIGAGAHTDYGSVTLLMTDDEPGLQIRSRAGEWIDAPAVPGAFVVNIGDCLMRWTNDVYVSTPHRVLPPKRARKSIAFFLDPNPDSLIEALPGTGAARHAPVLAADYLRSRLEATYQPEPTS